MRLPIRSADPSLAGRPKRIPVGWGGDFWGTGFAIATVLATATGFASPAAAHPLLDRAEAQADQAEFGAAVASLDEAARDTELNRAELRRLLERRAMVHAALGQLDHAERDLAWLAAIAPQHTLGPAAPPALQERFKAARRATRRSPFALTVHTQPFARGLRISAALRHPPEGLKMRLELAARPAGANRWKSAQHGNLFVQANASGKVEYFARVRGPGGAVLRGEGSPEQPRKASVAAATPPSPAHAPGDVAQWGSAESAQAEPRDRPRKAWPWALGIGGGLVAAAVVAVLVVTLRNDSETTQFGQPTIIE